MSDLKSKLWVKKYKPINLSQYIYQDDNQKKIINSIIDKELSGHILLSGIQGSGKTTLSNLIISELKFDPSDILRINASDETSIDVVRNNIMNFISVSPTNGDYRVIQLEEFDYMSKNAMAALRNIMEDYIDNCRFICTCNYTHKIIPAIKSRMFAEINFKAPDKTAIIKRIIEILLAENIKFEPATILKYVDICYPDLRKVIQTVQQNCVDGILLDPSESDSNDDYKFKFLELLEQDNWQDIRSIICQQVANEDIESVYRFLYENLDKSVKFKKRDAWESGQVMIADYLYKDSLVADREINLSALFIDLGRI